MTNKLKSLIYFSCFVLASTIYTLTVEEYTSEHFKQIELNNSTIAEHTTTEQTKHTTEK